MVKYWYHPESDALFTTTQEEGFFHPECDELSKEDYERMKEERGED